MPTSRSTQDIDLYRQSSRLDEALDLGDHFRFVHKVPATPIGGLTQPGVDGYRVRFSVFIGVKRFGQLQVDVVVGYHVTGQITTARPAGALDLPRLANSPYRPFPVVDQIADKVCATMTEHGGRPFSREKDLVDLLVFATTQDIEGPNLHPALTFARDRLNRDFDQLRIPAIWGVGYARIAAPAPHCAPYRTVKLASALVTAFINPALTSEVLDKTWLHQATAWVPNP